MAILLCLFTHFKSLPNLSYYYGKRMTVRFQVLSGGTSTNQEALQHCPECELVIFAVAQANLTGMHKTALYKSDKCNADLRL